MLPYFSFTQIIIGPVRLYTFGLFVGLAFALGYWQAWQKGLRAGLVWIFLPSIVGAYALSNNGMSFYGGLAGGFLGYLAFAKIKKFTWQGLKQNLDIIALCLPLSIAVGRIGCFLINDHQGAETKLPWGIVWPDDTIRHPVALYLILSNILIYFILQKFSKKLKTGQTFLLFLFCYSLARFFLDFTRSRNTPFSDPSLGILTVSQWISLVIIVFIGLEKLFGGKYESN